MDKLFFHGTIGFVAALLVLIALRQQNLVVVVSLAATAFTIFVMPHNIITSIKKYIKRYIIGMVFVHYFLYIYPSSGVGEDVIYGLVVACSMFTMNIINMEHPPAAGTALGGVVAGFFIRVIISILVGRY
jgi:hypothetical protein